MSAPSSKKRALIVGLNYTGTSSALSGCINDALQVREELITRRGYLPENITLMTDETEIKPTRQNILSGLLELIISRSTELFFHYSGHGSSVRDDDGDEEDGKDECLIPLDCSINGCILDDEIRGLLFCLRPDQKLTCILDCCHSGTGMDLRWNLYERLSDGRLFLKNDHKRRETRGHCVMFSGCQDSQLSGECLSEKGVQGAMTYCFLKSLDEGHDTYETLIKEMRKKLIEGGYPQKPNLSSGRNLNLKSKIF